MNAILSFSLLGWRTGAQNFKLSDGSSLVGIKSSSFGGQESHWGVQEYMNSDDFMVFRLYLMNEMRKNLIKKVICIIFRWLNLLDSLFSYF